MKKGISLENVARRAGVAKSTVSFVLNNKGNVAPHTREKVLTALQELGYIKENQPMPVNLPAATKGEKKNILIYVNPTVRENEVFSTYMAGLRDYANKEGNLGFSFAMSSSEVESSLQLQFLEHATRPKAILMIGINSDHPFTRQALLSGKPCLVINRVNSNPDMSYVSINHSEAGRDAARYLIALGHRHFALTLGSYYNETEFGRVEGLLNELAANPVEVEVALVRSLKITPELDGYNANSLGTLLIDGKMKFFNIDTRLKIPESLSVVVGQDNLSSNFNPTCLVAANDHIAGRAQAALQAIGLVVPGDVSVMSLNSSSISLSASPQITVIDELWHDQGYLAGRILDDLIEHKLMRCQKIQIRHRLIERGSTVRPKRFSKSESD